MSDEAPKVQSDSSKSESCPASRDGESLVTLPDSGGGGEEVVPEQMEMDTENSTTSTPATTPGTTPATTPGTTPATTPAGNETRGISSPVEVKEAQVEEGTECTKTDDSSGDSPKDQTEGDEPTKESVEKKEEERPLAVEKPVSQPPQYKWTDITDDFMSATANLGLGELMHDRK